MQHAITCELCLENILCGIVFKMKKGFYVCSDCKNELEDAEPVEFDGRENNEVERGIT